MKEYRRTDLHAATQTKDKVKGRLFLDVVIRKSSAILQLLASEDQTLLVWRDAFLILNLGLYIIDGIAALNFECDGLASD